MAPLPLLKLAAMFVKQLSKPIASRLKVEAARSQGMSDSCASVGQVAHQITSRISILASGYRIVGVKPLPYETAVADGITVISESIMYTIAGSIIIYEYARNESKNAKKAAQAAEQEARFRTDLEEKFANIAAYQSDLNERIAGIEAQLKEAQETRGSPLEPVAATITSDQGTRRTADVDDSTDSHKILWRVRLFDDPERGFASERSNQPI
eukprot:gene23775-32160_t